MSRIIHSEDDDDDDVGSQSSSSLSSPSNPYNKTQSQPKYHYQRQLY